MIDTQHLSARVEQLIPIPMYAFREHDYRGFAFQRGDDLRHPLRRGRSKNACRKHSAQAIKNLDCIAPGVNLELQEKRNRPRQVLHQVGE